MTYLLLQTFLLLLTAFFFGAFLSCILKRMFVGAEKPAETAAETLVMPPPRAVEPGGPFPHSPDPVQPKIEALPRPPVPAQLDTTRFDRALSGPAATAAAAASAAAVATAASAPVPMPPQPTPAPAAAPSTPEPLPSLAPPMAAAAAAAAAIATTRAVAEAAATASVAVTPAVTSGDDFTRIRAVDPALTATLHNAGINSFADIARWSPDDIRRADQVLGLGGRIEREQWVEQAQILARGGETYYSRSRAQGVASGPAKAPSETAMAAAAAIAAASAAARYPRPTEAASPLEGVDPSASRPAKLSDAIKEQEAKAAEARSAPEPRGGHQEADVEIVPSASAQPEVAVNDEAETTALESNRTDLAHLRSVRSEALRLSEVGKTIDDLKRIRGVGVLIEKKLAAAGITSYEQIANWTAEDVERVSTALDFKGRIERENWIEQARILSSGGQTEFSRRVDKGDPDPQRTPRT